MRGARHPNGVAGTGPLLARNDDDCGPVARCGRATVERPQQCEHTGPVLRAEGSPPGRNHFALDLQPGRRPPPTVPGGSKAAPRRNPADLRLQPCRPPELAASQREIGVISHPSRASAVHEGPDGSARRNSRGAMAPPRAAAPERGRGRERGDGSQGVLHGSTGLHEHAETTAPRSASGRQADGSRRAQARR